MANHDRRFVTVAIPAAAAAGHQCWSRPWEVRSPRPPIGVKNSKRTNRVMKSANGGRPGADPFGRGYVRDLQARLHSRRGGARRSRTVSIFPEGANAAP